MHGAATRSVPRALGIVGAFAALMTAFACGSSSDTFVAPAPTRCAVQAQTDTTGFTASGGTGTVRISTNRECTWSAKSDAVWIALQAQPTGQGDGSIQFTVAANADPTSRNAGVSVNDQSLQLSQQGSPCRFQLSSTQESLDASGGQRTIHVQSSSSQCTWTASADVPWIKIMGGDSGKANGDVVFEVTSTTGPGRSGAVTVAGQTVQVVQGIGCTYATSVTALNLSASGGAGEVAVLAPAGCPWTAQSQSAWITVANGSTGSGPGMVRISAPPTDGPPRTGTVAIAGVTVGVTQSSGCHVGLEPASQSAPAAGGASVVTLRAGPECGWSAASNSLWITITSAVSGSGDAPLRYTVAANTGPARSGSLTIGGQTFAISQPSGCTYGVAPAAVDLSPTAQTSIAALSTAAGCSWSAASSASWISLPQPSGSGATQVPFSVTANNGPSRSESLTIAGHTLTVNQASPCTWALAPPVHDFDANGGSGNVLVVVLGSCAWTAASTVSWLTMEAGTSGSGNGLVQFTVAPNTGPPRSGIVTIAGIDYQVRQAAR